MPNIGHYVNSAAFQFEVNMRIFAQVDEVANYDSLHSSGHARKRRCGCAAGDSPATACEIRTLAGGGKQRDQRSVSRFGNRRETLDHFQFRLGADGHLFSRKRNKEVHAFGQ